MEICLKCEKEIEKCFVLQSSMRDFGITYNPKDCEFWAHAQLNNNNESVKKP